MSYLHDRKNKNKLFIKIAFVAGVLLLVFLFRQPVFSAFSYVSHTLFRPVFIAGGNIGERLGVIGSYFTFKSSLLKENLELKAQLGEMGARVSNYNVVLDENNKLKSEFDRPPEDNNIVLAAILSKPNQSPYDTIVVDIGTNKNVVEGDTVFALGGVPIGKISAVFPLSSKVNLFSNSGQKTQVNMSPNDLTMSLVGRGGGNFEMILPRESTIKEGDIATLPGITPYTVAVVGSIVSDPRESFIKALLYTPVNIQEIKFVTVQK